MMFSSVLVVEIQEFVTPHRTNVQLGIAPEWTIHVEQTAIPVWLRAPKKR